MSGGYLRDVSAMSASPAPRSRFFPLDNVTVAPENLRYLFFPTGHKDAAGRAGRLTQQPTQEFHNQKIVAIDGTVHHLKVTNNKPNKCSGVAPIIWKESPPNLSELFDSTILQGAVEWIPTPDEIIEQAILDGDGVTRIEVIWMTSPSTWVPKSLVRGPSRLGLDRHTPAPRLTERSLPDSPDSILPKFTDCPSMDLYGLHHGNYGIACLHEAFESSEIVAGTTTDTFDFDLAFTEGGALADNPHADSSASEYQSRSKGQEPASMHGVGGGAAERASASAGHTAAEGTRNIEVQQAKHETKHGVADDVTPDGTASDSGSSELLSISVSSAVWPTIDPNIDNRGGNISKLAEVVGADISSLASKCDSEMREMQTMTKVGVGMDMMDGAWARRLRWARGWARAWRF